MRAFFFLASLALQPACDPPDDGPVVPRLADLYPDDPFAYGCSYDTLIEPGAMTAQGCAVALATCIDAGVESCAGDPKGCLEHQESCIAWVNDSCWPVIVD
ncbi:MAG TPA: hypothetical protein PKA64_22075 [Myxococcota bacterium]|nr:hypothetical protein [Myxococcota bacterium]